MEIEWDNNKAASNLIKHKIDFEDAKNIFLDPNRLEREDKRFFGLFYAMDGVIRNETFIDTDIAAIFVNCLRSGAN